MKLSVIFLIILIGWTAQSQVREALVSGRYSSGRQIASEKPVVDDLTIKLKPAKKSKKGKAPVTKELPREKVVKNEASPNPPVPIEKIEAEEIQNPPSQAVPVVAAPPVLLVAPPQPPPPVAHEKATPFVTSSDLEKPPMSLDALPPLSPYLEQVHPDDVRNNQVEVDILPFYFWLQSQSRYSFRKYNANSLGLDLSVRSNLDSGLIIEANYLGSFASDINANDSSYNNVPFKLEDIEIGIKKINYFGLSRRAMSVVYGASFFDNSTKVSSGEETRVSLKTNGIKLNAGFRIPTAPNYAHFLNLTFAPKLTHKEVATDLKLKSGKSSDNYILGLKWGGEIKMNRQNQLLWSIDYEVEKNLFSGEANTDDPKNGLKPENVSVTQTKTIFSFGYRWGE